MDVHKICLIGGITLNCVLAFYISEYLLSSLFSSSCLSILCCFRCTAPSIGHWGSSFHNNWYQSKVNVKMSAIKFDIQKFDGVINFSEW